MTALRWAATLLGAVAVLATLGLTYAAIWTAGVMADRLAATAFASFVVADVLVGLAVFMWAMRSDR
jgi:hypothetical protein